jgi:translation initiation factor 1 (eIF-1/SUI1)
MVGPGGTGKPPGQSDVYFEFTQIGPQMRVAAIDARTGTEVIVITPLTASQIQMQNLALAKLKRRLTLDAGQ